jgi:hypothetical protein
MMLRTAVIGAGSLGRQHARIHATLAAEGWSEFVAVCDLNQEIARTISEDRKTDWTTSWTDLIGRIDAASLGAHGATYRSSIRRCRAWDEGEDAACHVSRQNRARRQSALESATE